MIVFFVSCRQFFLFSHSKGTLLVFTQLSQNSKDQQWILQCRGLNQVKIGIWILNSKHCDFFCGYSIKYIIDFKTIFNSIQQGRRKQMDIGGGGRGWQQWKPWGVWGHAPQIILKSRTPKYDFQRPGKWYFIEKFRNELIGIELNSESAIACSMCARSVLNASLGSFIFFNKSESGSHFYTLSVLLCLIRSRNYWGGA